MHTMIYLFILCSLFNTTLFCSVAEYLSNNFLSSKRVNVGRIKVSGDVKDKLSEFLDIKSNDLNLLSFRARPQNLSCIAALEDREGNRFILKQKFNILASALEKLAADIAFFADIPVNRIKLIPCNVPFVGKKKINQSATLHTFVPGVLLNNLPKELSHYAVSLQLVQKERKNGKIIKAVFGITRNVIKNMSEHPDLAKIVALDTFLANHDRHRGNLFYDEETDHFYVIDLEGSFRRDLARCVYEYFYMVLVNKNVVFSKKEINGLVIYRDMLKKLVVSYSPSSLNAKFDKCIKQSQLTQSEGSRTKIKFFHETIRSNYNSCVKIVHVLDILLKKYL